MEIVNEKCQTKHDFQQITAGIQKNLQGHALLAEYNEDGDGNSSVEDSD